MKQLQIPKKYAPFFKDRVIQPIPKKVPGRTDYNYSIYSDIEIQRMNSNIKSILQSNYPTVLFTSQTESLLNSTGERLYCKVDWKPTPIYVGKEDVLEGTLHNDKRNLIEYISRRLKLRRLLKIDYFMDVSKPL